jgi:hypothetical protein
MVNEIIVAFLDTLPLDRHPESRPFTPSLRRAAGCTRVTPRCRRIIPDRPTGAVASVRLPMGGSSVVD